MLCIRNHETGEVERLSRDVRDTHPEWVHEQMGTESESQLQLTLDQLHLSEFAARPGEADEAGVFMADEDAAEWREEQGS